MECLLRAFSVPADLRALSVRCRFYLVEMIEAHSQIPFQEKHFGPNVRMVMLVSNLANNTAHRIDVVRWNPVAMLFQQYETAHSTPFHIICPEIGRSIFTETQRQTCTYIITTRIRQIYFCIDAKEPCLQISSTTLQ